MLCSALAELAFWMTEEAAASRWQTSNPCGNASDVLAMLSSVLEESSQSGAGGALDNDTFRAAVSVHKRSVLGLRAQLSKVTSTLGMSSRALAKLLEVCKQLQVTAHLMQGVCSVLLPLPSLACSNPGCINLAGLTEIHLVWRAGLCSHCRCARYCSRACLKQHWRDHHDPAAVAAAAKLKLSTIRG